MSDAQNQPETEHQHDENCNHEHDAKDDEHDDVTGHKASRGEKKFKKAMMKLGLKPVDNITRVTLRTNKNFVMYIDEPYVMRTGATDNSFVIFGEPKFLDFKSQLAGKQAEKFNTPEQATANAEKKLGDIKEEDEADDDAPVEQGDLKDEDIENLMSYVNCSRNKAIKTLKKANGDIVEAITMLS
mgnify:CR=1 FL=1